jgi:aminopeptidase N
VCQLLRASDSDGNGSVGGAGRLTKVEAAQRARTVRDVDYVLDLVLAEKQDTYRGTTTIGFDLVGDAAGLFLDFRGKTILESTVNGKPAALAIEGGRVDLSRAGLVRGRNTVRIAYENAFDHDGSGLHKSLDPSDGREYVFSDFEPFNAHKLFPSFDQPDLKASYALTVVAPDGWEVVANGRTLRMEPAEGGRRHVFETTPRFSTYVVCVCAGPYAVWIDEQARVPSRILARRSMASFVDAAEIFELTRQGFDFFETYFGIPYPYRKYDQTFVPDYNAGAMENVACVVHSDRFLHRHAATDAERRTRANVILHEMAHMWFGDLVTMEWWDDLWLNESFATYMATFALVSATRFRDAFEAFQQEDKRWAYWQDQLPTTHPIATEVPDTVSAFTNFDGITYGKGASVLKQLAFYAGPDAFRRGVSTYLARHANGNARFEHFLAAIAEAAGKDLSGWARAWLRTSGVNGLGLEVRHEGGKIAQAALVQTPGNGDAVLRPHRLLVAAFGAGANGIDVVRTVDVVAEGARTPVPALSGLPSPLFLVANHDDHAYAKTYLDDASLAYTTARLESLPTSFLRTEIWATVWNMVRDQKTPPTAYTDLFFTKAPAETNEKIVAAQIRNVRTAMDSYLPDAARAAAVERAQAVADRAVRAAPPGSDLQKVWFDLRIGTSESRAALDGLLALFEGRETIPGLVVDLERRWAIVTRLTATGHPAAAAAVAAQTKADTSERGERGAFRASVARPDPEAKATAWARFTTDKGTRLDLLRDGMGGFHWPIQRPLTAPYARRFFSELVEATKGRDLHFGQAFVQNLYPHYALDATTIDEAKRFLEARKDLPTHLRRGLVERVAEAERALLVRATVR